jgi:hypothetical protein
MLKYTMGINLVPMDLVQSARESRSHCGHVHDTKANFAQRHSIRHKTKI